MRRKHYFPYRVSERPAWFHNLATQLLVVNPVLGVDTTTLNARVADALYCEYLCGPWLTWARGNGETATAAVETLYRGEGGGAFDPPVSPPPPLPGALPDALAGLHGPPPTSSAQQPPDVHDTLWAISRVHAMENHEWTPMSTNFGGIMSGELKRREITPG